MVRSTFLLCVTTTLLSFVAQAQITITRGGRPLAHIVVAEGECYAQNMVAAELLQRFIRESSGAKLSIRSGATPDSGDVFIGANDTLNLSADGFRMRTDRGVLRISGGTGNGVIYGVVTFLEQNLGMEYYAPDVYTLDRRATIVSPAVDQFENPAFEYRQSQAYGLAIDPVYRLFLRLDEPQDIFAGGMWVHTFNALMPVAIYGKKHPEYYSYINGMRRPGRASQWCLTNPDVLELVVDRIDSIFKANPSKRIISVSQNDSDFTYCRCEACEKINEHEGAASGNYIHFLNKIAERFPDKQFSTLAYLFTMKPPCHVKPLPNVNIMLCNIDCKREVPLTDNASGSEFVAALKGWSAISDNIFVWDYGINFDNMVAPFPNFPILKPNLQLFRSNDVVMHFSQIGGSYGGDFSEMRAWVVSKLMWNLDQDTDQLMLRFMKGYYGAASPYIYQYEKLLEGGLLASSLPLWIYDSPVSHKDGMLNDACRKRYGQLFDLAEAAVADHPMLLRRVRMARLPLLYSNLEIARTKVQKDLQSVMSDLASFENYVTEFGVEVLNERNNSPIEYCQLYRERYLPSANSNKALGATINWIDAPEKKYIKVGESSLTDGLFGGASFVDSWTGWEGRDGAFVLDLASVMQFESVETDFLHQLGAWILLPRSVTYSVSNDGCEWRDFGRVELSEDDSVPVKFVAANSTSSTKVEARYIRVYIEGVKSCPSWHYGVGSPCWFFLDEVTVR